MKSDRCPVCKRLVKRTHAQNALLWRLYTLASEQLRPNGHSFGAESFHAYYKLKYLGADEVALPNGKTVVIPRSTANLDVAEFSDFFDRVQADLAERGVYLDEVTA